MGRLRNRRTGFSAAAGVVGVAIIAIVVAAMSSSSPPPVTAVTVTTLGLVPQGSSSSSEHANLAHINAVSCPHSTSCIGVGATTQGRGGAVMTSDGGRTWQSVAVPAFSRALMSVSCLHQRLCVAVGDDTIIRSTDSGHTWRAVGHDVPDQPILSVDCTGSDECITAGFDPSTQGAARGEIDRSMDGGQTWQSVALPGAVFGLGSVECPTSLECIAVGDSIFVTHDAGFTWQPGSVPLGFSTLSSVSCADSQDCVAVGPNATAASDTNAPANAISTQDGGLTWQPVTMPLATGSIRTVSCADDRCVAAGSGLAVGQPAVFVTKNATGSSFHQAQGPPSMTEVGDVLCRPSLGCISVGAGSNRALIATMHTGTSSWSLAHLAKVSS